MIETPRRILVTGGGTFIGDAVAAALLAEGVDVTLLVRPGAEERIGPLAPRVRWFVADVWNPGSLKGRGRGHQSVIHTVGSLKADPARGLSYDTLNLVSARNVANMAVNSGVPHMVLLSSPRAPWINGGYIRSKREAEAYIARVGLRPTIIRAPMAYARGRRRPLFFQFLSLLGSIPPLSWTWLSRVAPMPVDVLARGVARITLDERATKPVYYARELRRRNSRQELRQHSLRALHEARAPGDPTAAFQALDDESPFGWTP